MAKAKGLPIDLIHGHFWSDDPDYDMDYADDVSDNRVQDSPLFGLGFDITPRTVRNPLIWPRPKVGQKHGG
jgi:hypothetical protein